MNSDDKPESVLTLVRAERDGDFEEPADKPGKEKTRTERSSAHKDCRHRLTPSDECFRLTAVHVRPVRKGLCLPPEVDSFFLLLLQDQAAQVGLDLKMQQQQQGQKVRGHISRC